jgi:MGT family glycosyltransferase
MSRILAYTSPAIGHLFPMTPLLLELQTRGHEVHLRTLAGRVEQMRELGFQAEPIDPRIEGIRHDDYTTDNPRQALALSASVFAERGELEVPDIFRAIDQVRPDALIIDINTWGAAFAAESWGGPWVSFSPYTPVLASAGTPPFGPGLAPIGGPLGKLRDAVLRKLVVGVVEKAMLPRINALRTSLGLESVSSADEFFRKAPLMLVATAKPFEYATTDWGPDVVMIGALDWDPPQTTPDWLSVIDRPIVLVTTSSEFQDDGVLVRTALEGLADEAVHVIATLPAGLPEGLHAPANATIAEFVPHSLVLERAAVAITHGGMGATQKALSHGVPVCVVPFGRDQLEVARRVEVSGAGVRLPAKKLTPDRLRSAVALTMTKSEGARRVAEGFVASGGAARGADDIERRLLAGSALLNVTDALRGGVYAGDGSTLLRRR